MRVGKCAEYKKGGRKKLGDPLLQDIQEETKRTKVTGNLHVKKDLFLW
jgi:hypothetical protein